MTSTNRLIHSHSPYLLQHAHNPVDWYEWSNEAFEKASREHKPIFLSIGYSTCHWCHVMAHLSFENDTIANYLNDHYVCIKVDREERPHIDHIYMDVCRVLTGSGGWPLSVFLTPDQKPIYAGTYYPPNQFLAILTKIQDLWTQSPDTIAAQSSQIMAALEPTVNDPKAIDGSLIDTFYHQLAARWDPQYGGFSRAPKFPSPSNLFFLLDYASTKANHEALAMVDLTLRKMRLGGIYDHLGGGFSRYSTDRLWRVPHFEKMLYDNALLIMVYSEFYLQTKAPFARQTVEEIITYLVRDMHAPEGGFYTAEDADSEGHEGLFYTFTLDEINAFLKDNAPLFCDLYQITREGNFDGRTILNLAHPIAPEHQAVMAQCRATLLAYRNHRVRPAKDTKILTGLNGLVIAALAKASRIFHNHDYLELAENALLFIQKKMFVQGRLYARYHEGDAQFDAYASDYAYLIWGLIELHQATFHQPYLDQAQRLQETMVKQFYDTAQGGFYLSAKGLIHRPKEWEDGAIPSTNAIALYNLQRLSILFPDAPWTEQIQQTLEHQMDSLQQNPLAYAFTMKVLMNETKSPWHFVIVAPQANGYEPFLQLISQLPHDRYTVQTITPTTTYPLVHEKATIYVCQGHVCLPPVTTVEALQSLILN